MHQSNSINNDDNSNASHTSNRCIPTFLSELDKALKGGIRVGTITEVVGKAGVGKTQLGLQLCIAAAHYQRGSIYIDTEQKLSVQRLQEMAREQWYHKTIIENRCTNHVGTEDCLKAVQRVLENVSVHQPQSSVDLFEDISKVEEEVSSALQNSISPARNGDERQKSRYPIQLLILDSIAAPFKREFASGAGAQRASMLLQLAQILKRIAQEWNIAVVTMNQVDFSPIGNTIMDGNGVGSRGSMVQERRNRGAAMGTAWHHCVSTRLFFEHSRDPHFLNNGRCDFEDESKKLYREKARTVTITKSNQVGKHVIPFHINKLGIVATRQL